MTALIDGQVKCDGCGTLDGNTDMKLVEGWTRAEPEPRTYRHYCPECSKRRKK